MAFEYNPNANAYDLIKHLSQNVWGDFPDLDEIPRNMTIYQYEQIAPHKEYGLRRQMGIDMNMEARRFYDRLRMFNLNNGYFDLNKNLPLPQNIRPGVILGDNSL